MAQTDDYRRRAERSRLLGFASPAAQRRAPRRLIRPEDFRRLPEAARASRSDAALALALARRRRITVEESAGEVGVPMAALRWWFPNALRPTRRGRTRPTKGDRYLRLRPLAVEGEVTFVPIRGSHRAELAMEVFGVQWGFIHGHKSAADLAAYQGVRIGWRVVETDPDILELLGRRGEFEVSDIYRDFIE